MTFERYTPREIFGKLRTHTLEGWVNLLGSRRRGSDGPEGEKYEAIFRKSFRRKDLPLKMSFNPLVGRLLFL